MSYEATKPKMSSTELIKKLEIEKGVTFSIMNKEDAAIFLMNRNNYMRISSYRKNYEKYKDKYINLEFQYLVELSTIDMHLRFYIIEMCLDIEHCMKVNLLKDIENNPDENGYSIVSNFLSDPKNNYIISNIIRKGKSQYNGELIQHYFKYEFKISDDFTPKYTFDCPAWVFVELISFGDFVNFYNFYYKNYNQTSPISDKMLSSVKSLRNACAHNNCVMHDLHKSKGTTVPKNIIVEEVKKISSIGKGQRNSKLSNQFLLEFTTLLFVFSSLVSEKVKQSVLHKLQDFAKDRLIKNINYFKTNHLIKSSIEFLKKVIDFYAEKAYNINDIKTQ